MMQKSSTRDVNVESTEPLISPIDLVNRLPMSEKVEDTVLSAPTPAPEDGFGTSVAIDGDLAIVGSVFLGAAEPQIGEAFIYRLQNDSWQLDGTLNPSDGELDDHFGYAVAITGVSGETAVVGAQGDDDQGLASGKSYVFRRVRAAWVEQARLNGNNVDDFDNMGKAVAIDGETALVCASFRSYVFTGLLDCNGNDI